MAKRATAPSHNTSDTNDTSNTSDISDTIARELQLVAEKATEAVEAA